MFSESKSILVRTHVGVLAEDLDSTETGVDVNTGTGANFSVGELITIDSEVMIIGSITDDTLTVTRGIPASTHLKGATVTADSKVFDATETSAGIDCRQYKKANILVKLGTKTGAITFDCATRYSVDGDVSKLYAPEAGQAQALTQMSAAGLQAYHLSWLGPYLHLYMVAGAGGGNFAATRVEVELLP